MMKQMAERTKSYAVIVPDGVEWPIKEKTKEGIYKDMLKLGCQLKTCDLMFGDGTKAKIKLPIK